MYEIQKLDGLKIVAWNGTKEDLEGFNVRVINLNSENTFMGKVENGYAVASNWLAMTQITKALRGIK